MIKSVLAWTLFAGCLAWGSMAGWYSLLPLRARLAVMALYLAAMTLAVTLPAAGPKKALCAAGAFAALLAWWLNLRPTNERDWSPDVAVLPWAEVSGDSVTVHNIRYCHYRTETDYDVRHYDKTLKLSGLRTVDLFLGYWGLPHIAHTMLSFGFADGSQLAFSIETRKKKGDSYSSVRGFFRQYELTYVVADERDVVRVRTDFRKGEDIYLFRMKSDLAMTRTIFLEYLAAINGLRERPRWYNALTANCTTSIWKHVVPHYPKLKLDWRLLASGYSDRMVYDLGLVDTSMPFEELKRKSYINPASRAAGDTPDYSKLIRKGLPGF